MTGRLPIHRPREQHSTSITPKPIDAPEHRARGALAGLRRVLAVDGFDVLSVHEDDVALDHRLLAQQFGLGGGHDA